jgi:hypothetical protein
MRSVLKRVVTAVAAVISVIVVTWAHPAWAQTADEVIEKSVTALGGRASFAKLKSRRTAGTITLQTPAGDIAGTVEVLNALPNKTRTLINADLTSVGAGSLTVDQRFDGTKGYVLDNLQGNRDITGEQLDNMRNTGFPHLFLKYKDLGIAAKLIGKEKVGDRDTYLIAFEPTTGSTIRQFIDAETYLPIRAVIKVAVPQLGQDVEQTSDVSDYRDVDGVKIPFKLSVSSNVQNYTIVITKVEHNTPIDDALFVKP